VLLPFLLWLEYRRDSETGIILAVLVLVGLVFLAVMRRRDSTGVQSITREAPRGPKQWSVIPAAIVGVMRSVLCIRQKAHHVCQGITTAQWFSTSY